LLFNTAPDLLEDFKQFLPESAAQAKSQAVSARQTTEDASIVSNVRGEPNYSSSSALAQAQSSRSDVKMPPLGQFNVKDSTKESKKRRGGPGAQGSLGSATAGPSPSTVDSANIGGSQANRIPGVPIASVNKVSEYFSYYCRKKARAHMDQILGTILPSSFEDIYTHIYHTSFSVIWLSPSDVFQLSSHLALLLPTSEFFLLPFSVIRFILSPSIALYLPCSSFAAVRI
jgi:paired amphipathic helix protein Sin3a